MEPQMPNTLLRGKKFPPNRSKKNAFAMYVIGSLFVATGAILYFFSYPRILDGNHPGPLIGVIVAAFGSVMLLIVTLVSTVNAGYYVNSKGIVLKRGRHIKTIPFEQIREVRALSEKEVERDILALLQFKRPLQQYPNFYGDEVSGLKVFLGNDRYGSLMFLSVLVASWKLGGVTPNGVDLPGSCVEIHLKNQDCYLISPLDPDAFVKEVKQYCPAFG